MARTMAYCVDRKAYLSYTNTERGTKRKATMSGSNSIGYISTINNMYIETHRKENGKWIEV